MSIKTTKNLMCGVNCFRYLPQNEGQTQQNYECYVGSGEGAVVRLKESCVWADILTGPIDQGSPRTPAESELSKTLADCGSVIRPTPSDEAALAHRNAQRSPSGKRCPKGYVRTVVPGVFAPADSQTDF